MAEIPISALAPQQQELVKKARAALGHGNLDYVIEGCAQVLRATPECVAVRRLQRAAQLQRFRIKNRLHAKAAGGLAALRLAFDGRQALAEHQFALAEKLLATAPTSVAVLRRLGEAARVLGWPETAVFAFDAARELQPENRDNLLALGGAWLEAAQPREALRFADAVLRMRPTDPDALDLLRRASVAQMMTKTTREAEGSPRIKRRHEADESPPEPAANLVTSEEMTRRLIDETRARVEREPENLNYYRSLVRGYRQLGRLDEALTWLGKLRERPEAAADATLEKLESELRTARLEQAIEQSRQADPGDTSASARREQARRELAEFRLAEAQRLVERHPHDLPARQALGTLLREAGKWDAAIAQFQQARRNPQVRIAALLGLGQAFKAKGLLDLAVTQLMTAQRELGPLDDTKKEVTYELGACLEAMGRKEEAITEFKAIYGEDIGFRDVAAKIDEHYSRG